MNPTMLIPVFLGSWGLAAGIGFAALRRRPALDRLEELYRPTMEGPAPTGPVVEHSVLDSLIGKRGVVDSLRDELWRAGMQTRPTDFIGLALMCGLLLGLLYYLPTHRGAMSLVIGLIGMGCPWFSLKQKQAQRRAKFESQLPDMLSLTASSLRSGFSFQQALQVVAREMPSPTAEEVGRLLEEIQIGLTLDQAFGRLVGRVGSYDMDLVSTAISIQSQVGGNLAELMDNIGETIRERFRSRGEIAALTAEGKLSGVILFLLPLALLAAMGLLNPSYIQPLFVTTVGRLMLAGALLMQVIGGFIILRMVALEV